MRKIILLGLTMLSLIFIVACDGQLDTLEWVEMPDSVYEVGAELSLENIKIRINGAEFTLKSALSAYPEDVTFTGFDTKTPGTKTITVKYKSVSIYWSYEVLGENVEEPEEVQPSFDWYVDNTSPYTIKDEADLYGLAAIVNGEYEVDNKVIKEDFAGKVIRLDKDMDLSGKIWTPIGAAPKYVNTAVEYNNLTEVEKSAAESVQNSLKVGERALFASYLFVEKTANGYNYFKSTTITDSNKGEIKSAFFKGTFDGQGYKIIGLSDIGYAPKVTYEYATSVMLIKGYTFGLFGVVSGGATVKNLVFEDLAIVGAYYDSSDNTLRLADIDGVGAAIGFSTGIGDIVIEKVKVMSGFINAGMSAGGIAGRLENEGELLVKDSENRADITIIDTGYHAGGLVAYATAKVTKAEFINVVNHGDVTLQSKSGSKNTAGAFIGSIAGSKDSSGYIFSKAVNFGDIKGFSSDEDVEKHKNMINLRTAAAQITVSEDCVNFGTALVYQ